MDKHESCQINEKQGGVRLSGATRSTLALPSFLSPSLSVADRFAFIALLPPSPGQREEGLGQQAIWQCSESIRGQVTVEESAQDLI